MILGLVGPAMTHAAPPATAQAEVAYLLSFVEESGCKFLRNGSWYDSQKARAHLEYKYDRLAASSQISTAEDFIDKAATKSSMTGQPYEVRCRDGAATTLANWLRNALACYRRPSPDCAPRAMRGELSSGARRSECEAS